MGKRDSQRRQKQRLSKTNVEKKQERRSDEEDPYRMARRRARKFWNPLNILKDSDVHENCGKHPAEFPLPYFGPRQCYFCDNVCLDVYHFTLRMRKPNNLAEFSSYHFGTPLNGCCPAPSQGQLCKSCCSHINAKVQDFNATNTAVKCLLRLCFPGGVSDIIWHYSQPFSRPVCYYCCCS